MQKMRNHITLMGNLGSDVQLTELTKGRKMARVSIATNDYRRFRDGEYKQFTQWYNLVGWGRRAESMKEYLSKGMYVLISGKLNHRSYEDENGNIRYLSEIIVDSFNRLQSKAS